MSTDFFLDENLHFINSLYIVISSRMCDVANTDIHLHLVSDATGETNHQIARACLVQFEGVRAREHVWSLVRTSGHIEKVLAAVKVYPGPILFTLVDLELRQQLEKGCQQCRIPCISVLDGVVKTLGDFLGQESHGRPGRQHELDAAYFNRIRAMDFTLTHDDGQMVHDLEDADIVIVGVSRTSKTPTALYLANRGYATANIPVVPGVALPEELYRLKKSFVIALTNDPNRLTQVRRNRMLILNHNNATDYVDLEKVRAEVIAARKLFTKNGWPVIDVTRRSIEETAATILQKYAKFHGLES